MRLKLYNTARKTQFPFVWFSLCYWEPGIGSQRCSNLAKASFFGIQFAES